MSSSERIDIEQSAQSRNENVAEENRQVFRQAGVTVMNMIGSPGCGKTSILEYTAGHFDGTFAAIIGDVETALDSERLSRTGVRAVPIETGGSCHLTAEMVRDAAQDLNLEEIDFLFVENVGNLVCPSTFDLGEEFKVAVVSLPEGEDKVRKYPALFVRAKVVLLNKMDLAEVCGIDTRRVKEDCRSLRNDVKVLETSAKTGDGFEEWFDFLRGCRA